MIKLAVPDIGIQELEEVKKVFDSKYLVQGDKVEEFENLIKEYLNVKHAIAVSSGTAALHLALLSLGVKAGDEVIVPDFTFPATANVVELVGATNKFVDIKLNNFCIDEDQIEKRITDKTKVIMPVHEFGQSANMDKIMLLAQKYKLSVVEDAACAIGAKYKDKMVGTIGDVGCFSLHPRKAITTGEGGIVVTNDDKIAEKIGILRNHGLSCVNGKSEFVMAGFNYRMTNIQGAIGKVQMSKLDRINNEKKKLVDEYNYLLKNVPNIILPKDEEKGKHVWQTYHILLSKNINRDEVICELKKRNIETNFGAYAVHKQSYYREKYNCNDSEFENSIYACNYGIALPLHNYLEKEDISYIVTELDKVINK